MTANTSIQLSPQDNVAVVLADIAKGSIVEPVSITAREPIPRGHKLAVAPIKEGETVIKYGQIIGFASAHIAPGEHVHVHNVSMGDFERDYAYGEAASQTDMVADAERATFQGYRREDGRVGTRNYVGIVTSVNCSATVAKHIAREIEKRGILDNYPNVDGIVPIVHGAGCCTATDDEGFRMLQRTVWGHARHANFASVLMLGLGCETNQIPLMLEVLGKPSEEAFHYTTIQDEGGTRKTVEEAVAWFESVLPAAEAAKRESVPVSELTVALQCGGSDGYSGITANPALGLAVDHLVRHGGSGVLAETPEIYGAEHLLTRRAVTKDVGEKLIERIRWWEDYAAKNGASMDNNPTPGNKAGGLTTILEKSLGAVAKGGSTNLAGVYEYAEPITTKGFAFMDSPGYDPVSITGEVASGCNLVAFTTGRGSVYGNKPAPSLKLATNTPMYEHMAEDMDINCGTIIDGTESLEDLGEKIFRKMLAVASGERTKSEEHGFGDAEFAPWQVGAQM
ncbi:MAG: altronate dehydratase [Rhodospirillales bacterium]|nr:altronate dehydratase [Rhodospirillales bacterium]